MSEDTAFFVFLGLAFGLGAASQRAWVLLLRTSRKRAKHVADPYVIQISCDNTEAVRGFAEATDIANKYSALLDEINVKSVECRRNMELIRPPKDLH